MLLQNKENTKMIYLTRPIPIIKSYLSDENVLFRDKYVFFMHNLDYADLFDFEFVLNCVKFLLKSDDLDNLKKILVIESLKKKFINRLHWLLNSYLLLLKKEESVQKVRNIIFDHIFDVTNLNMFATQIFRTCVTQGWLIEGIEYIKYAQSNKDVKASDFLSEIYFHLRQILELSIKEEEIKIINNEILMCLNCIISFNGIGNFNELFLVIYPMFYTKDEEQYGDFEKLAKRATDYTNLLEKNTIKIVNKKTTLFKKLMMHDSDLKQQLKFFLEKFKRKKITVIFCSGPYIKYFDIFFENNKSYIEDLLVVSLDEEASRYFEMIPNVFHVKECIYNDSNDFLFFLWRKRFEVVLSLLEEGIDVCLCGVDSLFENDVIKNFSKTEFDIVAGNGPGLTLSSVKKYGYALNCDMIYFKSNKNVIFFLNDVLDYSGVFLQDQSSINNVGINNGGLIKEIECDGVIYATYASKYSVKMAIAIGNFMVRSLTQYKRIKDRKKIWVFQASDKTELLTFMTERGGNYSQNLPASPKK